MDTDEKKDKQPAETPSSPSKLPEADPKLVATTKKDLDKDQAEK
jgi:hypothetical protein